MTLANYAVAFLDLQGQTERLSRYSLVPDIEKPDETLIQWIRSTFGLVTHFRSAFRDYLASSKSHRYSVPQLKDFLFDDIKIDGVSDSIILYTSLYDTPDRILLHDLHTMIGACGSLFLLFLSEGVPFRGGMDIGVGMELEEIGFYGSAISKAYYLESKVANYPRIVVGTDLMDYLRAQSLIAVSDAKSKVSWKMAKDSLSLIVEEAGSACMLDVLNPYFRDLYGADAAETYRKAYGFILAEIEKYRDQESKECLKLLTKYQSLKTYFDAHQGGWV